MIATPAPMPHHGERPSVRADVVHIAIAPLLAATQRGEPLPDAQCGTKPMEFVI
ncbi:hypothetical protein [Burkholderia ambifaria]|jgi:hypothetical protein|nr:hypothetical protein [Burkholderia ambifaria]